MLIKVVSGFYLEYEQIKLFPTIKSFMRFSVDPNITLEYIYSFIFTYFSEFLVYTLCLIN